ncbi:hypothetical protein [Halomontanus rarus]|uniref:hypothetical protein n=1 Tax=Halomontanus rarus TaxID=3034020 RepID=UPI001A988B4A
MGAWAAYCSGHGIAGFVAEFLEIEPRNMVLTTFEPVTAADLFNTVNRGDPVANDYLDCLARYNAAGLGTRPHLEQYVVPVAPDIQPIQLSDDIGLYNALTPYTTQHDKEIE